MPEFQEIQGAQARFQRLQQLLLEEDRAVSEEIRAAVQGLQGELVAPEEIKARVSPFIEEKVQYLQTNFPELFGPVLTTTIKRQIEESQDEMVEALYPIMGKMIRKFVAKEIERLTEQIDRQIDQTFSWKAWVRRIKGWFGGKSEKDHIIQTLAKITMEEVYLVDKDSGLLAGLWSRNNLADRDMVAGMLTAIKAFVEDAFANGAHELETIEYDAYKILIRSFHTFYVAVVVSGTVTSKFKTEITDSLLTFASEHRIATRQDITEELVEANSKALEKHLQAIIYENQ